MKKTALGLDYDKLYDFKSTAAQKSYLGAMLDNKKTKEAAYYSEDDGDTLMFVETIWWETIQRNGWLMIDLVNGETIHVDTFKIIWI